MIRRVHARWALPLAALAGSLALLAAPRPAVADESNDLKRATELYDEALPFLEQKDYATACPKLEKAVSLVGIAVGARLALADCYAGQGKLGSALSMAETALALATAANQKERVELAKQRIESLTTRAGRVELKLPADVSALPDLKITLDGKDVPRAAWSQPRPADKGTHTIAASASGRTGFEQQVIVEDGQQASVIIALPEAARIVTPPPVPSPPPPPPPQDEGSVMSPLRIVGIVGGSVGLVGIGIGAAFGAIAISKKDESTTLGCNDDNVCTNQEGIDVRNDAISAANVATGMFVAGGVLLAAGVTLAIVAPTSAPAAPRKAARLSGLTIGVGPGGVTTRLSW